LVDEKCDIGIDEGSLLFAGYAFDFSGHYDGGLFWSMSNWNLHHDEGVKNEGKKKQELDSAKTLLHLDRHRGQELLPLKFDP